MSTKHGSLPVSVSLNPIIVQNINRPAFIPFREISRNYVTGLPSIIRGAARNLPINIESLLLMSSRKNNIWGALSHSKYTKPQKSNKTDRKDAKWIFDPYMRGMMKPSFILPADICQLRKMKYFDHQIEKAS